MAVARKPVTRTARRPPPPVSGLPGWFQIRSRVLAWGAVSVALIGILSFLFLWIIPAGRLTWDIIAEMATKQFVRKTVDDGIGAHRTEHKAELTEALKPIVQNQANLLDQAAIGQARTTWFQWKQRQRDVIALQTRTAPLSPTEREKLLDLQGEEATLAKQLQAILDAHPGLTFNLPGTGR